MSRLRLQAQRLGDVVGGLDDEEEAEDVLRSLKPRTSTPCSAVCDALRRSYKNRLRPRAGAFPFVDAMDGDDERDTSVTQELVACRSYVLRVVMKLATV